MQDGLVVKRRSVLEDPYLLNGANMSGNNGFTPTERKMLSVLRDGLPHKRDELHKCLDDDMAQLSAIQPHISRIRRRLEPLGETILCVLHMRAIHYQQVRMISSGNDGRT